MSTIRVVALECAHPARVEDGSWAVVLDADGTIYHSEGSWPAAQGQAGPESNYFSVLPRICGPNAARAGAVMAGIQAVAAGREDAFSLEFPCALTSCAARTRLAATRYHADGVDGVLVLHSVADHPHQLAVESAPSAESDPWTEKLAILGRMTSGVAHDFGNLLTLISGYSEMLLSRLHAEDDPLRPALEEIRSAAARGSDVTSHILEFIRDQEAPPGIVNLNTLVTEVGKLLQPLIGEHIKMVTILNPDLGDVLAAAGQMTRVIMNLLLNARDAMPRGGQITITTANVESQTRVSPDLPPGHYVMLTIADTGMGIDPEMLHHLFEPFHTTKEQGTGLGLSTAYRMVKRMRGDIWADSQAGQGTTFTVCLPRTEQTSHTLEALQPLGQAGHGSETILLAEDDESVRKLIKHLLSTIGYQVFEAVNGGQALELFHEHAGEIDLLITDMVMPGLNGRELANQAVGAKPALKVIFMSGYTDDVLLNTGALGPDISYLRKPLKLDALTNLVRQVLDSRSSE